MSTRNSLILAITVLAVAIQLYPPVARDNPPGSNPISVPPEVDTVLRRSCYSCHSNDTEWPWYSAIAPASWLVAADVQQARMVMNFSNWPEASPEVDCFLKKRIQQRARSGEMPPSRYVLLHPEAVLTSEEMTTLETWTTKRCGPQS